ncbi:MAG: methionyl-tRNA formyltransferase [Clostridiaceae bacterium]|nr:methionyl-tRNA formyltransferase [Clostridiaceae bacterium]
MAFIHAKQFNKIEKNRNSVHKPADATYTTFEHRGKKYFQIDTYGSADRLMPEKVSQSIQIDEEMARKLIDVLKHEFFIE